MYKILHKKNSFLYFNIELIIIISIELILIIINYYLYNHIKIIQFIYYFYLKKLEIKKIFYSV